VFALLVMLALRTVDAQARVELVPTVGLYLPSGNTVDQFGAGCSCQVTVNQEQAFLLGLRLTVWPSARVGLETSLGVASSGVHLIAQGQASGDTTGTVKIVSERVIVSLTAPTATTALYVGGGLAYVTHDSPAYEGLTGTNDLGAGLAVGLRFRAGSSLTLQTEAEDYIYSIRLTAPNSQQTDAKRQNDLVISIGLAIRL
jgi:hypothetical protein